LKRSTTQALVAAALCASGAAHAAEFEVTVTNITAGVFFTPIIASAHPSDVAMFELATEASPELQAIAEGGDVSSMAALLESVGASVSTSAGLLGPGQSETLTVSTSDANTRLSLSSMLLPTNDGFLGLNSIALPANAGVTEYHFSRGYDAGTEANDEIIGSGAPGEAGFPAPPPIVASGTGTGGIGVPATAEGFITVHRGVLGDLDPEGGYSDINAAVHTFNSPVARIAVRMIGGGNSDGAPSTVDNLFGISYSRSALEIFWEPAISADSVISTYEIRRDGESVASFDGLSFFEEGLDAGTEYRYTVRAVDANGNAGEYQEVLVTTNAN